MTSWPKPNLEPPKPAPPTGTPTSFSRDTEAAPTSGAVPAGSLPWLMSSRPYTPARPGDNRVLRQLGAGREGGTSAQHKGEGEQGDEVLAEELAGSLHEPTPTEGPHPVNEPAAEVQTEGESAS